MLAARRRILVVSYYFPPVASTGSNRWGAMVAHLRRLGHDVSVITAGPTAATGVIGTADLRRLEPLRRAFGRPGLSRLAPGEPIDGPAPALFTRVLLPDLFVATWIPFALRAVRRALRSRDVDCLITTSPPESTHLIGLALGARRPPWLVDLRDGWSFEPHRESFPLALQRHVDAALERSVMRGADRHVAVTRPIVEDLRARFGVDAAWVPNGFDPDLEQEIPPAVCRSDVVVVAHTGRLSRVRGRDPRPLFEALALLRTRDPALAGRLRLVLAGPLDSYERDLIASLELDGLVDCVGSVPRSEAIAIQREASALLLVTSGDGSESTGKLFEYLVAGRPIVALAGDNEAARIVRETGTGIVVRPDDPQAIAEALARIVRGEVTPSPRDRDRFIYPAPARALLEQVELAIATRRDP